jgi:hypothetical protein
MESALVPAADELLSIVGITVVFIRDEKPLCVDPAHIAFIEGMRMTQQSRAVIPKAMRQLSAARRHKTV